MSDDQLEQTAQDRATIARLADEVVPALIERLSKSDLGELEVRDGLARPAASAHGRWRRGRGAARSAPAASGHGQWLVRVRPQRAA